MLNNSMREIGGFSLIEMAIVMFILSSLIGILFLTSVNFYRSQNLDSFVQDFSIQLNKARSYAIYRNTEYGIKIFDGEYYIFEGQSYLSRNSAKDEKFVIPSSIKIVGSITEFVFERRTGYLKDYDQVEFIIVFGDKTKKIQINHLGLTNYIQ